MDLWLDNYEDLCCNSSLRWREGVENDPFLHVLLKKFKKSNA